MAMIEQLSPRLREALTRRAVPYAGGAATLLIVLLMGFDSISLHLSNASGYLLIPAALGAPTLLPGLRFSPLGEQSGGVVVCDDFAALVMVLIVVSILGRHVRTYPNSSRIHRLLTGWGSLVAAGFAAGFFQGLVVARLIAGGPLAYFGYPVSGALFGAGWALALGWLPGAAAVLAVGRGPVRNALARQWAAVGQPLLARGWARASAGAGAGFSAGVAAVSAAAARARRAPADADPASPTATASSASAASTSDAASTADGGSAGASASVAAFADTARTLLRRVGPWVTRFLRECRRLLTLAVERLRPLGVRVADRTWLIWDRSLRWSKRAWRKLLREVRLLRRIPLSELREVRSLSDLRALRADRGEKHAA